MKGILNTRRFCIFLLLACFLLVSCAKTTDFPQFSLTKPDHISITQGDKSIQYDKKSSEFEKIFVQIQEMWWKKEQNYEMVTDGKPTKVLMQINEENVDNQTVLVSFIYDSPIDWVDAFESDNIKTYDVTRYVFFPFGYNSGADQESSSDSDVGIMAVAEDANFYKQNNVYVFIYSQSFRNCINEILNA